MQTRTTLTQVVSFNILPQEKVVANYHSCQKEEEKALRKNRAYVGNAVVPPHELHRQPRLQELAHDIVHHSADVRRQLQEAFGVT